MRPLHKIPPDAIFGDYIVHFIVKVIEVEDQLVLELAGLEAVKDMMNWQSIPAHVSAV